MKKISVALLMILTGTVLWAQVPVVEVSLSVDPASVPRGGSGEIVVTCEIDPAFHISDASSGMFEVSAAETAGLTFGEPVYPQGENHGDQVYYLGTIEARLPFTVAQDAGPGEKSVTVRVDFQPCAESGSVCYPPDAVKSDAVISVTDAVVESAVQSGGMAGRLTRALESGSILAFLVVFLGGLLTSFTPCVYPMIPITMAVVGAQASGGKLKGFVLSLFYVLGIAVTFSTLGVVAAKTGAMFGAFSQNPVVVIVISAIFLTMGLSMLGAFVMQMPASIQTKLRGKKRSGFFGAFITGMIAGLVVSPCISPLLVVILTWVAKTGSVLLGVGLLFSFAMGLGVLFILIGTFSGIIKNLPKSGGWMEIIERGFGVALVALALVFLRPILPDGLNQLLWGGGLVILGTYLGAFLPQTAETSSKQKLAKSLGILALLAGASLFVFGLAGMSGFQVASSPAAVEADHDDSAWLKSEEAGLAAARQEGKPLLLDFYADWCAACKELDHNTWPAPEVKAELERYVLVKLDMTKSSDANNALRQKYGAVGMPTVIILSASGEELDRFEGYQPPETVASMLKKY